MKSPRSASIEPRNHRSKFLIEIRRSRFCEGNTWKDGTDIGIRASVAGLRKLPRQLGLWQMSWVARAVALATCAWLPQQRTSPFLKITQETLKGWITAENIQNVRYGNRISSSPETAAREKSFSNCSQELSAESNNVWRVLEHLWNVFRELSIELGDMFN